MTARHRPCAASTSVDAIANPAAFDPGPLVTFVRCRTVANGDSIGFVVRRCTQCCPAKSWNASSSPRSWVIVAAALGHLTPCSAANALAACSAWARSCAL